MLSVASIKLHSFLHKVIVTVIVIITIMFLCNAGLTSELSEKSMNVSEAWLLSGSSLASQVHAAAVNGHKSALLKQIAGKNVSPLFSESNFF